MSPVVINEASSWTENSNKHDSDPSISGSSLDSEDGKDSSFTNKTHNFSTGMGNQWHTIYTVCLDHLSTPDIWGSTDKKIPIKKFNIENLTMKMPNDREEKQIPLGSGAAISHPYQSSVQDDIDVMHNGSMDIKNSIQTYILHKESTGLDSTELLEQQLEMDACMDMEDPPAVPCCDDVLKQHFGNLSSNFKTKGKQSSAKSCYSAGFVVKYPFRGFVSLTDDDHVCGKFDSAERTSSRVLPLNFEDNEAT